MSAPASRTAERLAVREQDREPERTTGRRLERPSGAHMRASGGLPPVDPDRVPRGYVMEWKRHTILGATDRRNLVHIAQFHWQPVPHEMQPHILGQFGKEGEHITFGGQGLYMRPAYLNDEARAEQRDETDDILASQLQQMRESREQVGAKHAYMKKQRVAIPTDVN